jgi:anaphase-promoting complex subunit 1
MSPKVMESGSLRDLHETAEIGRKPGIDAAIDREGYALSAGLALGLVCLGRGNEAVGLADLHIEDRLHHYLAGGSERTEESRARELALGLPKPDDFETSGGQILEGDMVNVDVTAPGATLALALMFLKTNNETVAARLKIPDTHFDLEYVRPDFILLRVLARSLIMWDSVSPTENWVLVQVPEIVRRNVERRGVGFGTIEEEESDGKEEDVDTEALAQANVNILAGACFAIGVRFAGTGNEDARALLHKYVLQFVQQKRGAPAVSSGDSKRVDK